MSDTPQAKKPTKNVIGPSQAEERILKAREKQGENWMEQLIDAASEVVGEKVSQIEVITMPDGSKVLQIVVKTDGSQKGHPETITIAAPLQHVHLSSKPS